MTEMHKQALESIYRQVLQRLVNAQGEGQRLAMLRLAEHISHRFPELAKARLVVLCSGERDGLLALALLRGVQLLLAEARNQTFRLKVVIPAMPGLTPVDDGNIERVMATLFLIEDPRVEVLGVSDTGLFPYERMMVSQGRGQQGLALLHITLGGAAQASSQPRDVCLLASVHWLWSALEKGAPGDLWVTPQPKRFLLRQGLHARRLLRSAGALGVHERVPCPTWLPRLAGLYKGRASGGRLSVNVPMPLSVHEFLPPTHKRRWQLATECLGMHLDPFSVRHGLMGCEDALLGAHLTALSVCYYQGDHYAAGLGAWLRPRLEQLRREGAPARKLAALRTACLGERAMANQECRLRRHVEERYGMSEEQLCCVLFQPFSGAGAYLKLFLERCHPDQALRECALRQALEGHAIAAEDVRWLQRISGLSLAALRRLYTQPARTLWAAKAGLPALCSCTAHAAICQPSTVVLTKARHTLKAQACLGR